MARILSAYKTHPTKEISTIIDFPLNPDDSLKDIPWNNHHKFIVPADKKESELKDYIKENPFVIRIYDEEIEIGTARVDLMKLFKEESLKYDQRSFQEKAPIFQQQDFSSSVY